VSGEKHFSKRSTRSDSFCHILKLDFYKRLHISLLAKSYKECRKCSVKVVNAVDAILEEHPNRFWHDPRLAQ